MSVGDVEVTLVDGGSNILVPGETVQVVIGVASGGSAPLNTVVATQDPNTIQTNFGYGQLPEYAALCALGGGTVLCLQATLVTKGTAAGVVATPGNTSTSVVTTTLNGTTGAFDDYYVKVLVAGGGTIGTAGCQIQVSLDAGRNYGPTINLGTATTYAIPNTGITLNFGAGTLVAGDSYTFGTTGPATNTAGIQSALNALLASPYSIVGWSSMHILGNWTGAQAATIETYLDTFATPQNAVFTRAMLTARDASPNSKWGGSGETETAWLTAIENDYSALSAKRIDAAGGHYNIPSAYANPAAGAPAYRRPGQWAAAVRQVQIPPQRHSGRVRDGALANIVVDPTNDPKDGFIYHDDRLNPSLDGARFTSFCTRKKRPGWFVVNPNLMSPLGSDFSILPLGNVADVACDIVIEVGGDLVNEDTQLNTNGTIDEKEAQFIESQFNQALFDNMTAHSMISKATAVVNRTWDVQSNKSLPVTVRIFARGYIFNVPVTVGFGNAATAGG